MEDQRVLILTSVDYFGAAALSVLHRLGYETVLCVVCGGSQGLDVIAECQKHGYSNFVSDDAALLGGVCQAFSPTLSIGLGPGLPRTSLCLDFEAIPPNEGSSSNLDPACSGEVTPSWPEFFAIFSGAETSRLRLCLTSASSEDITTPEAEVAARETLGSVDVPVTPFDTAISLRYKHVTSFPALLECSLEALRAAGLDGTSPEVEEPSLFDFNSSSSALLASKSGGLGGEQAGFFVDSERMSLEEADRFIRGCSFPPYDPPLVKSALDGCDYYVDSVEHYLHYLRSIGQRPDGTSITDRSGTRLLGDCETTTKQYSADTHWYSNVGGTIVKVQAETMQLRKRNEVVELIPGAAVSAKAKKRLRMNEPLIGLTAYGYIQKALSSGWIGVEGPYIKKFEAAITRVCQVEAACAVQSGTAALYGAMKALGVSEQSHRVIVPTYTCAACADAIAHAGGVPIAVDCELDSYGLDFDAVREAIMSDEQIVGVVIAPSYGTPSRDHLKIYDLCREQGLWLCEDNCESYGAVMQLGDGEEMKDMAGEMTQAGSTSTLSNSGRTAKVGSMSTMSVISVRSEKMVGVGEGGAILSKDAALVSKARWWCSRAPVRGCGLWRVYEHETIGQNYRLPELLGAVGLSACENLPVMIERKRRIHQWYKELLGDIPFLQFQHSRPLDEPVWWLNALLIRTPANIELPEQFRGLGEVGSIINSVASSSGSGLDGVEAKASSSRSASLPAQNLAETVGMGVMREHPNIEMRPAFYPLHKMSCFADCARYCPNADFVYERLLCVPSSAQLTRSDVEEVCQALRNSLTEVMGAPV
ncbi:unnamed protein product [Amoebophrya sp. A25]|nr:unnamed protein product [Amoebophrya sp. A25]|eukprot:GSA25T00011672001.1